MKKQLLFVLLLLSSYINIHAYSDLEDAIIASDLAEVEYLFDSLEISQDERLALADLAQQVIDKRKDELYMPNLIQPYASLKGTFLATSSVCIGLFGLFFLAKGNYDLHSSYKQEQENGEAEIFGGTLVSTLGAFGTYKGISMIINRLAKYRCDHENAMRIKKICLSSK